MPTLREIKADRIRQSCARLRSLLRNAQWSTPSWWGRVAENLTVIGTEFTELVPPAHCMEAARAGTLRGTKQVPNATPKSTKETEKAGPKRAEKVAVKRRRKS